MSHYHHRWYLGGAGEAAGTVGAKERGAHLYVSQRAAKRLASPQTAVKANIFGPSSNEQEHSVL